MHKTIWPDYPPLPSMEIGTSTRGNIDTNAPMWSAISGQTFSAMMKIINGDSSLQSILSFRTRLSCILGPELSDKVFRKNRACLIQKIHDVDPLDSQRR